MRRLFAAALTAFAVQALHAAPAGVYLQDLTSTEVRDALRDGTRMVIIPVGGTEQSGPHLVLGKHNARVRLLAERVARTLGQTLVAPVLAYVPEGSIAPPASHMRWAGTLSIPESTFESLLESAALSLRAHGFTRVLFIGEHGGYHRSLQRVQARLQKAWAGTPAQAWHVQAYYRAAQVDFANELQRRGYRRDEIGTHAGLLDTSLSLALVPGHVRRDKLAAHADGVGGDPRRADAELGRVGADIIVRETVAEIRKLTGMP